MTRGDARRCCTVLGRTADANASQPATMSFRPYSAMQATWLELWRTHADRKAHDQTEHFRKSIPLTMPFMNTKAPGGVFHLLEGPVHHLERSANNVGATYAIATTYTASSATAASEIVELHRAYATQLFEAAPNALRYTIFAPQETTHVVLSVEMHRAEAVPQVALASDLRNALEKNCAGRVSKSEVAEFLAAHHLEQSA